MEQNHHFEDEKQELKKMTNAEIQASNQSGISVHPLIQLDCHQSSTSPMVTNGMTFNPIEQSIFHPPQLYMINDTLGSRNHLSNSNTSIQNRSGSNITSSQGPTEVPADMLRPVCRQCLSQTQPGPDISYPSSEHETQRLSASREHQSQQQEILPSFHQNRLASCVSGIEYSSSYGVGSLIDMNDMVKKDLQCVSGRAYQSLNANSKSSLHSASDFEDSCPESDLEKNVRELSLRHADIRHYSTGVGQKTFEAEMMDEDERWSLQLDDVSDLDYDLLNDNDEEIVVS